MNMKTAKKMNWLNFVIIQILVIWDGMYLESELLDKKGWGHSSVEQGIDFANKINVKNFLISHHAPLENDTEIKKITRKYYQ